MLHFDNLNPFNLRPAERETADLKIILFYCSDQNLLKKQKYIATFLENWVVVFLYCMIFIIFYWG